ncbi:MAG: DNA repair protein RecO [Thermodesulfovibrionales bacterium]|nr:DNA repair protein RecO [Thermodesulfovibrionales bacterium]
MLKRTEGIVLKNSLFGEADLIVTYLTRDYGLLKVFAKSPRKIKSRFGSSLEPLTYSRISFIGKEDSNLPRLTQSDILKSFSKLREEYKCFMSIAEILELNLDFLPEREPNPEIFNLLFNMLLKLEAGCNDNLYYLYYKIKFLELTGYSPKLDVCGRCGIPLKNGTAKSGGLSSIRYSNTAHHSFYVVHGSIICGKCGSNRDDSIKLSDGTLKFYRSFLKWRLCNISRIKVPKHILSEISCVINSHVKYIFSR